MPVLPHILSIIRLFTYRQHLGQKTTTDRQQLGRQCGAGEKVRQRMPTHWGLRPWHPRHPWLSGADTGLRSFFVRAEGEPHYLRLSRAQSQQR